MEDEDCEEGFCPFDDEEAFWRLEDHDAFVLKDFNVALFSPARCEKARKVRASAEEQPFRKPQSGGKANMAGDSTTDQSYWGTTGKQPWYQKGKGKPFNKPRDKTKDSGKGDRGKGKPRL